MKAKTDETKNLYIVAGVAIVLLLIALIFFGQSRKYAVGTSSGNLTPQEYYDQLENLCAPGETFACCSASVEAMRSGSYELAVQGLCAADHSARAMQCAGGYDWCAPQ